MFVLMKTTGDYEDTYREPLYVSHSEERINEKLNELKREARIDRVLQKKLCRFVRKYIDANPEPVDESDSDAGFNDYCKRLGEYQDELKVHSNNFKRTLGIPENRLHLFEESLYYYNAYEFPRYHVEGVTEI